jgi:hypothetical protein
VIAVNLAVGGGGAGALTWADAEGTEAPDDVPGDAGALLEASPLLEGNGGNKGPKDDGMASCFARAIQPTSMNETTTPITTSFGVGCRDMVRG